MTVAEAKKVTDDMFDKWDNYKKESLINPNVKYLEYVTDTPVTQPALGIPTIPSAAVPGVPSVPSVPGGAGVPNIPDINQVFGGASTDGSIQI